jgi:hypothetical protein
VRICAGGAGQPASLPQLINRTDCGLMQASEQDLRTTIENRTGTAVVSPRGFVYDVTTGLLREIDDA